MVERRGGEEGACGLRGGGTHGRHHTKVQELVLASFGHSQSPPEPPLPVLEKFVLSHRTVPNEAGNHRAASEPPLGRGRFVCNLPTRNPHKYNGLYGPGFISVMTPGDPLPPPSRHIEPPFSVGEVREVVEKPSTLGRIFRCVSRPAPGWGGVAP